MENRTLEQKVDELTRKVDTLKEAIKILGKIVGDGFNQISPKAEQPLVSNTQTQSYSSGSDNELIAKNTINWDELLIGSEGTKSEKFVRSIYNNTYPTVTPGQYKVLESIADQLSISLYS